MGTISGQALLVPSSLCALGGDVPPGCGLPAPQVEGRCGCGSPVPGSGVSDVPMAAHGPLHGSREQAEDMVAGLRDVLRPLVPLRPDCDGAVGCWPVSLGPHTAPAGRCTAALVHGPVPLAGTAREVPRPFEVEGCGRGLAPVFPVQLHAAMPVPPAPGDRCSWKWTKQAGDEQTWASMPQSSYWKHRILLPGPENRGSSTAKDLVIGCSKDPWTRAGLGHGPALPVPNKEGGPSPEPRRLGRRTATVQFHPCCSTGHLGEGEADAGRDSGAGASGRLWAAVLQASQFPSRNGPPCRRR